MARSQISFGVTIQSFLLVSLFAVEISMGGGARSFNPLIIRLVIQGLGMNSLMRGAHLLVNISIKFPLAATLLQIVGVTKFN